MKPDAQSYNYVMQAARNAGEYGAAQNVWSRMQADGVKPTLHVLTTLVGVRLLEGRQKEALDLIAQVRRDFADHSGLAMVYVTPIRYFLGGKIFGVPCRDKRNKARAYQLYEEAKAAGVELPSHVHDSVTHARQWDEEYEARRGSRGLRPAAEGGASPGGGDADTASEIGNPTSGHAQESAQQGGRD
mmetsp:Transcript_27701/g.92673  ORF Transcript_27701/g.92673 Transcript_27701/m.92673 type:complete len:187 (+) Transcript_27701:1472-2032(+)